MTIKKNTDGTFDLQGMTAGKLQAIVNAITSLQERKQLTTLQVEIRETIEENPDFKEATQIA